MGEVWGIEKPKPPLTPPKGENRKLRDRFEQVIGNYPLNGKRKL
jgi:hypothetical protein